MKLRALGVLAIVYLSTSELSCPCTLQHHRIRALALGLQATLIGSQPHCTMPSFSSFTLSYIIIAMYCGKIMICTSIHPGWNASQGATEQTIPFSPCWNSVSAFFLSLSLPQQTHGICYLSPNLLCFHAQWFINRVLFSISKDTKAGIERGRGRNGERGRKRLKMLERHRGRREVSGSLWTQVFTVLSLIECVFVSELGCSVGIPEGKSSIRLISCGQIYSIKEMSTCFPLTCC